jgi:hypothetical protein
VIVGTVNPDATREEIASEVQHIAESIMQEEVDDDQEVREITPVDVEYPASDAESDTDSLVVVDSGSSSEERKPNEELMDQLFE